MPPSAILAAVDFSRGSLLAAEVAARIARRHRAALTLLHVDSMPDLIAHEAVYAPADVWESYLRDRDESARRMLEEQAGALGDVAVRIAVARDDVPRAILQRAEHDRSSLVVVGALGAAAVPRSWLGTVPFEVAAHASCPVLVVREPGAPHDASGFRRPLLAVGADRALDAAVTTASWLCSDDATFHVVHVFERPSPYRGAAVPPSAAQARARARSEIGARLQEVAVRLRAGRVAVHLEEAGSASQAIFDRVDREKHDLVVVGQRASSRASGSLGAVARRLLEYARVSVAVIPAPGGAP